ncbi:MAG: DedA family protein [Burkholderiales bacterium]|nr:DedA family protein [Burkholderiales bacterium]
MSETASLLSLFASSFLAATLLPGGSEAVLFGVLKLHPDLEWPALLIATFGNTLGGMTSFWLGKAMPEKDLKALSWVKRHGTPALLFAWAPLVGDALCVASGWLRLNPFSSAGYMAFGKFARYFAIALAA